MYFIDDEDLLGEELKEALRSIPDGMVRLFITAERVDREPRVLMTVDKTIMEVAALVPKARTAAHIIQVKHAFMEDAVAYVLGLVGDEIFDVVETMESSDDLDLD